MKTLEEIASDLNLKVTTDDTANLEKQAAQSGSLFEFLTAGNTNPQPEEKEMNDFFKQAGIDEPSLDALCIAAAIDIVGQGQGMDKEAAARNVGVQAVIAHCSQFNKEATMQKVAAAQAENAAIAELQKAAEVASELIWKGFLKAAEASANGTNNVVNAPGSIINDGTSKTHAPQMTVADNELKTLKANQSASIPQLVQKALGGSEQGTQFQLADKVQQFIGK